MVNGDESFWRCEEYHLKTWAPVNSQSIILHTNGSEKAGFTAVATVSLSGKKFPLILIGKGSSIKVEKNWFGSGRIHVFKLNQKHYKIHFVACQHHVNQQLKKLFQIL